MSKQMDNFRIKKRHYYSSGISRTKSVKQLNDQIPSYLKMNPNWVTTQLRGGTAPEINRNNNQKRYLTSRKN